jgi:hypothetical protein
LTRIDADGADGRCVRRSPQKLLDQRKEEEEEEERKKMIWPVAIELRLAHGAIRVHPP